MTSTKPAVPITIHTATVAAYAVADKATKATIRRDLATRAMAATNDLDAVLARDLNATLAACTATSNRPASTPTDPKIIWADRVATADAILSAVIDAARVAAANDTSLDAMFVDGAFAIGGTVDATMAAKVSAQVIGHGGPRRDIGTLITDALATFPVGRRVTVAQLIAASADRTVSPGAVAARLWPAVTVDGVAVFAADDAHSARTVARTA